jgi:hypothetical protein
VPKHNAIKPPQSVELRLHVLYASTVGYSQLHCSGVLLPERALLIFVSRRLDEFGVNIVAKKEIRVLGMRCSGYVALHY